MWMVALYVCFVIPCFAFVTKQLCGARKYHVALLSTLDTSRRPHEVTLTVTRSLPRENLGKPLCCTRLATKVYVYGAVWEGARFYGISGHSPRSRPLLRV